MITSQTKMLLAIAVCTLAYGNIFILIAVAFGLIGGLAEYLFGKATELFISKKLWAYNHMAMNKGHFTPLSLIFFSLAGFYFWGIGLIIESLLK